MVSKTKENIRRSKIKGNNVSADNVIDIVINQKSSFEVMFTIKEGNTALNLTNYTTAAKLKTDFNVPDNQAVSFNTAIVNAASGTVSMSLTPEQTANLAIQKYKYDFTITANTGFKTRVVEGTAKVSGGVS